jgi:2,4'-dihydroxyacetophenone dioxygenase
MTMLGHTTTAVHIGDEEIPWVTLPDGSQLKLLQVRAEEGLWIIRTRFNAGYQVQTHRHTGPVWGYTVSGAWKYAEYDYVNRAGSFLYEPAGSVHTLTVLDDNTEITDVWFHMYGANLNLDADGNVESVTDGTTALMGYYAMCEMQGIPRPNGILVD